MERLRHDFAFALTLEILDVFNLRDEEKNEAFGLIYERLTEGLRIRN